jgi:hypothetical protein
MRWGAGPPRGGGGMVMMMMVLLMTMTAVVAQENTAAPRLYHRPVRSKPLHITPLCLPYERYDEKVPARFLQRHVFLFGVGKVGEGPDTKVMGGEWQRILFAGEVHGVFKVADDHEAH